MSWISVDYLNIWIAPIEAFAAIETSTRLRMNVEVLPLPVG
jgi:hypothetical protein